MKNPPDTFKRGAGLTLKLTVPCRECGLAWCHILSRCPAPCDDQSRKPLRFLRIHASPCTLRSKRHLYMSLPYLSPPFDAPRGRPFSARYQPYPCSRSNPRSFASHCELTWPDLVLKPRFEPKSPFNYPLR